MKLIYILILLFSFLSKLPAETELQSKTIAANLDTPWEILWGPDNHVWMTERMGRVSRLNPANGELTKLLDVPEVFEDGERGLMGMVLHPNFKDSAFVYLVYNYLDASVTKVRLVRYSYEQNALKNPQIILDNILGGWNHDGARLLISEDRKIWMTMGERGQQDLAQNLNNYNGKILRMNLDGSVPDDNPFKNSLIWSWGHRNPQGLVFANGLVYSSEHGPSTDDELNIIEKGRNYGWPTVKGYCDTPAEEKFCSDSNVVEPILSMSPLRTYAVAGIDYYNSDLIPEWKNSIIVSSLKDSKITIVKLSGDGRKAVSETHYFVRQFGRLRDVCVTPDGKVLIATSNKDGRGDPAQNDDRIIEISPVSLNSIEENSDKNIYVFPNPSRDDFKFSSENIPKNINIFTSGGELIVSIDSPGNNLFWNGRDAMGNKCPQGMYLAELVFEKSKKYLKIEFVH